ncbi:MAG TPA: SET domain-containing protein-lysine N-methyltransferase [Cytophagales bacterium]|nr:SET domain-containing protein-lysine N-methyltransferase [Cytophagales bacterium]HCR54119.1 SET domain-containing protein-lysine N-methyltransferase [Cytophagales bacterium]
MALLEKQLYTKKSTLPGAGKGLFTKKKIKKGTRIVEYKGEILTWKEVKKLADDRNGYVFYISSKRCIDAWNYKKALGRYANDAKGLARIKGIKTNSEYVIDGKKCFIEAIKDIPAKSEIFVEYGSDYWKVVRENLKIDKELEKENGKKAKLPHHKATKRMK